MRILNLLLGCELIEDINFCESSIIFNNSKVCKTCKRGYYPQNEIEPNTSHFTECVKCNLSDSVLNNEICYKCSDLMTNCLQCSTSSNCVQCQSNYYLWEEKIENGSSRKVCDECVSGRKINGILNYFIYMLIIYFPWF